MAISLTQGYSGQKTGPKKREIQGETEIRKDIGLKTELVVQGL